MPFGIAQIPSVASTHNQFPHKLPDAPFDIIPFFVKVHTHGLYPTLLGQQDCSQLPHYNVPAGRLFFFRATFFFFFERGSVDRVGFSQILIPFLGTWLFFFYFFF